MRLSIKCLLLLISILFFAPKTFGQDEQRFIALKQVLDTIAVQHNVKFNYAEKDIFQHTIPPPEATMPLRAKLVYITNRTGLNYKENGEYIVLYKTVKIQNKKFCAYITDEFGAIIENASVQISNDKSIVAGADGYFELNTTSLPEKIYVGHLGYKPVAVLALHPKSSVYFPDL